ncbi:MAG: hypothetical protein QXX83_06830, partial [Thermofilum sp.]
MAQKTQKIPMLPALAFLVIGLIVGAVVGYLLAPRPAAPAAPAAPEYTFYYVSHGGPADPWWAPVIKGSQDAAALLNVKVV